MVNENPNQVFLAGKNVHEKKKHNLQQKAIVEYITFEMSERNSNNNSKQNDFVLLSQIIT